MEENITKRITHYMLHDPVANAEAEIAEYDPEKLRSAEDAGAVFIAVYSDGDRQIVKAADITEPQPMLSGVELAQPCYVDERMEATVAVFEALEPVLAAVPMAVNAADEDSAPTFAEALADLKAIVYGEAQDADA